VSNRKSYLIILIVSIAMMLAWSGAGAQSIFLDPQVKYITTGVGTEFDLQLKVDAGLTSLKSFVYHFDFDPTKLDTVSVTQGPLLPSSGASTAFGVYIVHDTVLQIEDLILGAGIAVAGPGLVATIRFRVLDTGTVVLAVTSHRIRNVNGTLVTSQAYGASIYINVPPEEFNLLSPVGGVNLTALPGEQINLSWEASSSVYPDETVRYTLQYGTSPTFEVGMTTTVTGLTTTTYSIPVTIPPMWNEGTYYWRVMAIGSVSALQRASSPASSSFEFAYTHVSPAPFNLVSPIEVPVTGLPGDDITFVWNPTASEFPGEQVRYKLEFGTSSTFSSSGTTVVSNLAVTSFAVDIGTLKSGYEGIYYWRVTATGQINGLSTLGSPVVETFFFAYEIVPPEPFALVLPSNGSTLRKNAEVYFDWQDAISRIPDDIVTYVFALASDPAVQSNVLVSSHVSVSEANVSLEAPPPGLPTNQPLYWRVTAQNKYGSTTLSSSVFSIIISSGCCDGRVGDANGSGEDEPTIGDVSMLIDAKFIAGNCDKIQCLQEADVNRSGGNEPTCNSITISDISVLIDYLFITGSSLGLANCP
jgi:hypothetical protein